MLCFILIILTEQRLGSTYRSKVLPQTIHHSYFRQMPWNTKKRFFRTITDKRMQTRVKVQKMPFFVLVCCQRSSSLRHWPCPRGETERTVRAMAGPSSAGIHNDLTYVPVFMGCFLRSYRFLTSFSTAIAYRLSRFLDRKASL